MTDIPILLLAFNRYLIVSGGFDPRGFILLATGPGLRSRVKPTASRPFGITW
jgi:hypothetical protein